MFPVGHVMQVAKHLLDQEILDWADMVELLGPRPFQEKSSYQEVVDCLEKSKEDNFLPEGLTDWQNNKGDKKHLQNRQNTSALYL